MGISNISNRKRIVSYLAQLWQKIRSTYNETAVTVGYLEILHWPYDRIKNVNNKNKESFIFLTWNAKWTLY